MKQNQKSRDNKWSMLTIALWSTLIVVAVSIIIIAVLLILDAQHACIGGWVNFLIGKEHHFSGETWFSIIAAFATAVPGTLCGVFALKQTQRLSDLEARYHRPVLVLHEATMKAWKLVGYDAANDDPVLWNYVEKNKGQYKFLIKIELVFEVKNEIEVKSFEIDELTWKTSRNSYSMKISNTLSELQLYDGKSFWRNYDDNRIICHAEKYIELCGLSEESQKQFENAIEMFVNYERRKDDDYKIPEIVLTSSIEYEYSKEKKEKLECRMQWDAQKDCEYPRRYYSVHRTRDGYFSYDIKN